MVLFFWFFYSFVSALIQLSFSFPLTEKKQKVKAARILLKSGDAELKVLKLAALKQQPLLNAPQPPIS
ncbi:MAG: hypothetical protein H6Q12_947 [Bacteroidetes bacterium]|nr:hypothetical protein [Bacteroidota bacterium]